MVEPTDVELAAINTIDDAAAWASVEGDAANTQTAKGSLYDCLGTTGKASPMVIGVHAKADFEAVLATWKVSMQKMVQAMLNLLGGLHSRSWERHVSSEWQCARRRARMPAR